MYADVPLTEQDKKRYSKLFTRKLSSESSEGVINNEAK